MTYVPSNVANYRLALLRELIASRPAWTFDPGTLRFYYTPEGLHGERLGYFLDVGLAVTFEDPATLLESIEKGAARALFARIDPAQN